MEIPTLEKSSSSSGRWVVIFPANKYNYFWHKRDAQEFLATITGGSQPGVGQGSLVFDKEDESMKTLVEQLDETLDLIEAKKSPEEQEAWDKEHDTRKEAADVLWDKQIEAHKKFTAFKGGGFSSEEIARARADWQAAKETAKAAWDDFDKWRNA
jgi:hypothetical protein